MFDDYGNCFRDYGSCFGNSGGCFEDLVVLERGITSSWAYMNLLCFFFFLNASHFLAFTWCVGSVCHPLGGG